MRSPFKIRKELYIAAFAAVLVAHSMVAQNSPAFDIASIKPTSPKGGGIVGYYTYPGGRLKIGASTLAMLVEFAFDVQAFQISGGPGWTREDRYDIEAKPPSLGDTSATSFKTLNKEQRQMLQTLLADRFQLKIHRETKLGPVYILSKGPERLQLQKPKDASAFPWMGSLKGGAVSGDGLAGQNISMPLLAERLSRYMGRPVLDQTGLNGSFDFKFEYAGADQNPDIVASLVTCVRAIGLQLKAARGFMEMIVIDGAAKPSEN